jgi:type I restriction-modification system DNA methylase subunit
MATMSKEAERARSCTRRSGGSPRSAWQRRRLGLQDVRARYALLRFISENLTTAYLNEQERKAGSPHFDYAVISDVEAERGRRETVTEKGFYILPSELFANVRHRAATTNLNETLARRSSAISKAPPSARRARTTSQTVLDRLAAFFGRYFAIG